MDSFHRHATPNYSSVSDSLADALPGLRTATTPSVFTPAIEVLLVLTIDGTESIADADTTTWDNAQHRAYCYHCDYTAASCRISSNAYEKHRGGG